jgi:nucleotide-binding universal stress UspA family protein
MLLASDDARLFLVHVPLPVDLAFTFRDAMGGITGGDVADHFQRLRDELEPYAPPGLVIETASLEGSVASAVLAFAEEAGADLVAAGTHGPGLVERFFVGSAATGILHGASCSALVSPAPSAAEFVRLELRMMDTATATERADWQEILDAASRLNAGRKVTVEVDDPAIGAQVQAEGYVLRGITFDPRDMRVEVMLGDGTERTRHLTRTIEDARSIAITTGAGRRDRAIEIAHGRGHTLILFED